MLTQVFLTNFSDEDSSTKRPSSASPLSSSLDEENRRNLQIKQERLELSSSHEETGSILSGKPLKRSRTDTTDAESNTINSGKSIFKCINTFFSFTLFSMAL